MRGGYQIINFKDTNLVSGSGETVAGVYDALEGAYRKPILITGLTIDGVEQNDVFVQVTVTDGSFKIELVQGSLVITDDDAISYIANE